jgi:hypothetical protein
MRLWQLAHYGFFGPPLDFAYMNDRELGGKIFKDKSKVAEELWEKLEDNTEKILLEHAPEVHAVAQALLERGDMTGRECIAVIRSAATSDQMLDSEHLLKTLVEETIVSRNGKSEEKVKAKPKSKAKQLAEKSA